MEDTILALKKASSEHMKPKISGKSHQGLERRWGRGVIRKSSALAKLVVRTQLLNRPEPWPRFSIYGQVETALLYDESSIWKRWAQDLCSASPKLVSCW